MNKLDISDALIERPVTFSYKRRRYAIYPLSLGKIQLCSRLVETLGLDKAKNDLELYGTTLQAVYAHKDCGLRLISYVTLPGNDCLDETKVKARIKELRRIKPSDLATLLVLFLSLDKTEAVMKEFGIDKESKRLSDVLKIKSRSKDNGSLSFGGKSIWGTLIDAACERYGWTYQYTIWGISFCNLQLLLSDHIKTVFLTEEERKRAPKFTSDTVISASDPKTLNDFIKSRSWR